jgi:hypothetical protein
MSIRNIVVMVMIYGLIWASAYCFKLRTYSIACILKTLLSQKLCKGLDSIAEKIWVQDMRSTNILMKPLALK